MENIELIRELIPLLQSAGEGAFVIALALVLKGYVVNFIWAGFLSLVVYLVVRLVRASMAISAQEHHAVVFRDRVVDKLVGFSASANTASVRKKAIDRIDTLLTESDPTKLEVLDKLLTDLGATHDSITTYSGRAALYSRVSRLLKTGDTE